MVMQGFSSFSSFVEQLIRDEHARQFPERSPHPPAPPAGPALNEPATVTSPPAGACLASYKTDIKRRRK
jgi:hypothetical protein